MFGTINCSFYALVGIDLIFLVWCLCTLPWAQFLCWETVSNPRIISQWLTVPPYTTFMSTLYNFLYLRFNFIYDQHLMLRVYTITCHPRRSSTEWSLNHIASYLGSLLITDIIHETYLLLSTTLYRVFFPQLIMIARREAPINNNWLSSLHMSYI